jgi:predicted DNA-binding transcriptional regulator YafY
MDFIGRPRGLCAGGSPTPASVPGLPSPEGTEPTLPSRRLAPSASTLLASARARASGRRLQLRYADAAGEVTEREVDVLGLAFRLDHWLLAAWCHLRHGLRLFRVERILSARVTRRRAGRRAAVAFDARAFATPAWLHPGTAVPALATVRLGPDLAPAWGALLPGALSELLPGGARLCHLRASRLPVLASLVASLGGRATLVRPRPSRPRNAPPPAPGTPGGASFR